MTNSPRLIKGHETTASAATKDARQTAALQKVVNSMKRYFSFLNVLTGTMVAALITALIAGLWALDKQRLPLGMGHEVYVAPTQVGITLIVYAAITLIASLGMIHFIRSDKGRSFVNWACLASWVCVLLIFAYGSNASGIEWLFFFFFLIPPIICWLQTGAPIKIPGEQW